MEKPKFSFSTKEKKQTIPKERDNFNIDELQKYYSDFKNNYNSTILLK